MLNNPIMNAKDAISASLAECFVTIEGNRYNFMQAINLEASIEKTKSEIPILGKTGKGNKTTGWKGSGSATITPVFSASCCTGTRRPVRMCILTFRLPTRTRPAASDGRL